MESNWIFWLSVILSDTRYYDVYFQIPSHKICICNILYLNLILFSYILCGQTTWYDDKKQSYKCVIDMDMISSTNIVWRDGLSERWWMCLKVAGVVDKQLMVIHNTSLQYEVHAYYSVLAPLEFKELFL